MLVALFEEKVYFDIKLPLCFKLEVAMVKITVPFEVFKYEGSYVKCNLCGFELFTPHLVLSRDNFTALQSSYFGYSFWICGFPVCDL